MILNRQGQLWGISHAHGKHINMLYKQRILWLIVHILTIREKNGANYRLIKSEAMKISLNKYEPPQQKHLFVSFSRAWRAAHSYPLGFIKYILVIY